MTTNFSLSLNYVLIYSTYVAYFSERDHRYTKWKMAVQRSLGWAIAKKTSVMTGMLTFPNINEFKWINGIYSK